MKRRLSWMYPGLWVGWIGCLVFAQAAEPGKPRPGINARWLNDELLERGKVVYRNHCIGCHGVKGDGEGPGAYGLDPKPRDFTSGVFKFRTTPSGFLPSDEDLFRVIRQGVIGTSMPAFDLMPEQDVLAVSQYLKLFSPIWEDPQAYARPLALPVAPPDWFQTSADREQRATQGKAIYYAACVFCHGEKGDGKGFSASSLVDNWNRPIKPADLRQPYIRGGRGLTDVYKALVTGVGTMPSFQDAMSEEQLWDLVAFIGELRRVQKGLPSNVDLTPVQNNLPTETSSDDNTEDYE